jgi:hypothetical protein
MYKIYQKANLSDAWMAWIPVLNVLPYFHVIDRSAWSVFYLIIPFANIYFSIKFAIEFLKAFGMNPWWVIGYLISPVNLIILLYIAFNQSVTYQLNNRFN